MQNLLYAINPSSSIISYLTKKSYISLTKKNAVDAIVGSTAGIIKTSLPKIKSSVKATKEYVK